MLIRLNIVCCRDQITLTKFLGSGAFGEVFEGVARGLQSGDTKVAIKVNKIRTYLKVNTYKKSFRP